MPITGFWLRFMSPFPDEGCLHSEKQLDNVPAARRAGPLGSSLAREVRNAPEIS